MKKALTALTRNLLRKKGQALIPLWRLETWPWEEHLRRVLQLYNVDCVIDVGANLGQFRDRMREDIGFAGPIISIEPVKSFATELATRADGDPVWRVFPFALGSENFQGTINVLECPGLSSLREPDAEAMGALLAGPRPSAILGTELVTVRRLDDVLDEVTQGFSAQRIFLKIDTQGYDSEVIKGASESLKRVVVVQTEISVQQLYKNTLDWKSAITDLSMLGFDISGLFPVTLDNGLRVIEFDCIAVSRKTQRLATKTAYDGQLQPTISSKR